MILSVFLSIFFVFGNLGILFFSQEKIGQKPKGERLERIRKSPNYDGKQFFNLDSSVTLTSKKSSFKIWKEFLWGGDKNIKKIPDSMEVIYTDLKSLPDDKDWIVWFGHSSYLLNLSNKKILVDPILYLGSPVSFINKMFKGTDVYKPHDFPNIDYLVITHDHYDHLDYQTVKELKNRVGKVICGLGVGSHFEYWGYSKEKLVELDWWEHSILDKLGEKFSVVATPARHFSGRDLHRNKTLWASFIFKTPKRTIWIGGDTGYGSHFKMIGEKFPGIDLAIIENGQYNNDWAFMHTLPKYLGNVMEDLNAKRYITVHHSRFCLSTHDYREPLKNAKEVSDKLNKWVMFPKMGEVIYLD